MDIYSLVNFCWNLAGMILTIPHLFNETRRHRQEGPAGKREGSKTGGCGLSTNPQRRCGAAKKLVESVQKAHPEVIKAIQNIIQKYGKMNTAELLYYTYRKYPDSA